MSTVTVFFNKIIIIQSLNTGRTGSLLQDDLCVLTALTEGRVTSVLFDVRTKDEFMAHLHEINREVRAGNYHPLIHIEAHGLTDTNGIALAAPENYVTWQEMNGPLTEINIATRLNLIVCISACYGANIAKTLSTDDRAPCWALVGPKESILSKDLLKDFTAFYTELLKSKDGGAALRRLYRDQYGEDAFYHFTTAEMFFERVWIGYIRDYCNNEALNERANGIIRKLKKIGAYKGQSRNQVKADLLRRQPEYFMESMEHYFMMDLFEESRKRFSLDYESVLQKVTQV